MPYKKDTPRIVVRFIDANTEVELFSLKDRNHTNVGELFTDYIATSVIESDFKSRNIKLLPDEIMVVAVAVFKKV